MAKAIKVSEKEFEAITHSGVNTPRVPTVRIAGNAMVITSKLDFATIQRMEKYNRDALCLVETNNNEEKEIFRIATGKCSSISKYGITFVEANKDGKATATVLFPEGTENKRQYVKDNFATPLFMLKDLEDVVVTACAELDADFAKLDNDIVED